MARYLHYFFILVLCLPSISDGAAFVVLNSEQTKETTTVSPAANLRQVHSHHTDHASDKASQANASSLAHDCCDNESVSQDKTQCCDRDYENCSDDCGGSVLALLSCQHGLAVDPTLLRDFYAPLLPEAPHKNALIPPIC